MLFNGYWNELTEVQELAVSMGNWAFPLLWRGASRQELRDTTCVAGLCWALSASVPAVSCPCHAVFYFFPLIIYKPLFPFECRYSREHEALLLLIGL